MFFNPIDSIVRKYLSNPPWPPFAKGGCYWGNDFYGLCLPTRRQEWLDGHGRLYTKWGEGLKMNLISPSPVASKL
jgi:hypothetical protein